MGLKHMLCGKWFTRLVLGGWIVCAISILVVFKNMEQIVHGQLYNYGLVFSPVWADPYRLFTWILFLCLGLPMVLSCVALLSSFVKIEDFPKKETIGPQKTGSPQVVKVKSRQIARPEQIENDKGSINSGGISCPKCNKVFGRALVMLDFSGGKNQLVSVCPYCNFILRSANDVKCANADFQVALPDEKLAHY